MCIVQTYSVLCQVGGLVDTGGHSITATGAGEAQRSHCQNLSTSKQNLAEAAGCWVLGDVEEAGTGITKLTPRDQLHKGDLDWTGQGQDWASGGTAEF